MNYRLHRDGQNLGSFSLDELHRRRAAGELNGSEFVWCEGMADWEGLDSVLESSPQAASPSLPPPIPPSARKNAISPAFKVLIGVGVCVAVGVVFFGVHTVFRTVRVVKELGGLPSANDIAKVTRSDALTAASKPVVWTSNTWTAADVTRRKLQFQQHLWVEDYQLRGDHTKACDAQALQFLEAEVARENHGDTGTNPPNLSVMAASLTRDPSCTDPLVLTALAKTTVTANEQFSQVQRALQGTNSSTQHLAFSRFYANLITADLFATQLQHLNYDAQAVALLKLCFTDGSFRPGDQHEIAEFLLSGPGGTFFKRNEAVVSAMTKDLGSQYEWLALVLQGQDHIDQAWKARGGGYADSVKDAGWREFASQLAAARRCLTRAWELHPEYPTAPGLMIHVSLGDANITEMRLWFDRAVAAQIDYSLAWSTLRWGLRPRWYGDPESMLALGVTAVNTGRFDTIVPEQLDYALHDLQEESPELTLSNLYSRPDVWPSIAKMYEGYIAAGPASTRSDRRNKYCVLSSLVGKYDVARIQLEALNWKLAPSVVRDLGQDPTLLALEVAARTGPASSQVNRAESALHQGDLAGAGRIYAELLTGNSADARTRQFARLRAAPLVIEQKLTEGDWVDFLPQSEDDPNWIFSWGDRRVTDGALNADPSGLAHFFFFSRPQIGCDIEVRGEFDVIQTPKHAFQAGLVMGVPEAGVSVASPHWYAFTMQRTGNGRETVAFSRGIGTSARSGSASLNEVSNTFDVTLHGDLCSATVNGRVVFSGVKAPRTVDDPGTNFVLGLVGSTQVNEAVIRYRKLQVRKLPPLPAAPATPPEGQR